MKIRLLCSFCNKEFFRWPSVIKRSACKYCSFICYGNAVRKENNPGWKQFPAKCQYCGKEYSAHNHLRLITKYCSMLCLNRANAKANQGTHISLERRLKLSSERKGKKRPEMTGEKHPRWLGGIAYIDYSKDFLKKIRQEIRKRDSYRCQYCGIKEKGITLSVHHVDYDKKNNDPKNLITLCRSHHAKTNLNRNYWRQYLYNLMKGENKECAIQM